MFYIPYLLLQKGIVMTLFCRGVSVTFLILLELQSLKSLEKGSLLFY